MQVRKARRRNHMKPLNTKRSAIPYAFFDAKVISRQLRIRPIRRESFPFRETWEIPHRCLGVRLSQSSFFLSRPTQPPYFMNPLPTIHFEPTFSLGHKSYSGIPTTTALEASSNSAMKHSLPCISTCSVCIPNVISFTTLPSSMASPRERIVILSLPL